MSVWGRAHTPMRGLLDDEGEEDDLPRVLEILEHMCANDAQRDPAIHLPLEKEHVNFEVRYGGGEQATECYMQVRYRERDQPLYVR